MPMDSDEDKEFLETLKSEFYGEAKEGFEKCENLLLEYKESADAKKIDEFMRVLHSMKGSARAVDLNDIAACFHAVETKCLDLKAKGDTNIDSMLAYLDKFNEYIDLMAANDPDTAAMIIADLQSTLKS